MRYSTFTREDEQRLFTTSRVFKSSPKHCASQWSDKVPGAGGANQYFGKMKTDACVHLEERVVFSRILFVVFLFFRMRRTF